MKLAHNIDERGQAVRFWIGVALLAIASVTAFIWAEPAGSYVGWTIAVVLGLGGLLLVFEAGVGWAPYARGSERASARNPRNR
jgi:hypothetical protein